MSPRTRRGLLIGFTLPIALLSGPAVAGAAPATDATALAADNTRWIGRMPLAQHLPAEAGDAGGSALARYVAFDDGAFAWEKRGTIALDGGGEVHRVRLTSQRWRPDGDTNRPLWQHWLLIAAPQKPRSDLGVLIIGGGRHRDEPRDSVPSEFQMLARATGAAVVFLDNVPSQPLQLDGDGKDRFEDDLTARSWRLAMRDDDATWIARFPMVKAAVKAMDASEALLASEGRPAPRGWFVVGASKRGWTAWLTAAVDPRVKGLAPMVIDVLNIRDHTPHHFASYGFWAPTLKDYEANGIPQLFGSPELAEVLAHEDPAAYLPRVNHLPRYIVNASGDEFFPTDSFRHYESILNGPWRLRVVPNAGHSLRNAAAPVEVLAFYRAVADERAMPELSWRAEGGVLSARASERPAMVNLWTCENAAARDFRLGTTGPSWTAETLAPIGEDGREFEAALTAPGKGWRAAFIEATFAGVTPADPPLVFTTRVYITPDTLPFQPPPSVAPKAE